jgi:hypothetical protein
MAMASCGDRRHNGELTIVEGGIMEANGVELSLIYYETKKLVI